MKYLHKVLFFIIFGILILPQAGHCFYYCLCDGASSEYAVDNCTQCAMRCGDASNVEKCLPGVSVDTGSSQGIPNPLNAGRQAPVSWQTIIGKIIQAILGLIGSLALLMFVYGGFTWMMAGGNNEAIQKGKNILIWATVGLVIIFSSYALVKMVFTGLGI